MIEGKDKTKKEFEELLLEVRKVTRVTTGGRRMSFRATVLVGNKKGKIGLGLAKGVDVTTAVKKATNEAYKAMFFVPITATKTVPYPMTNKYKSCLVKIIPATPGTGLKAGSSVRSVLELAGYENILSKIVGSNNKLNNALASIQALSNCKHIDYFTTFDKNAKPEIEDIEETVEEKKVEKKETAKKAPAKKAPAKKEKVEAKTEKKVEKKETAKKAPAKKTAAKKESK